MADYYGVPLRRLCMSFPSRRDKYICPYGWGMTCTDGGGARHNNQP